MKPIKQILSSFSILGCMAIMAISCATEPLPNTEQRPPDGTPIEMKINLTFSDMPQVITRAVGDENYIDPLDVKVIVFDESADPKLLQMPISLEATTSPRIVYKPITGVTATTKKRTFLVIANAGDIFTNLNLSTNDIGVKTLSEIKEAMKTRKLGVNEMTGTPLSRYSDQIPKPIFSATLEMAGITWKSAISADGTIYGRPLELARNLVKISINLANPTEQDKLIGGTLWNVRNGGYAINPGNVLYTATENIMYSKSPNWTEITNFCKATTDGSQITPLYAYESEKASVIITATRLNGIRTYYCLDLIDEAKKQIVLNANYHYIIQINKINGYGYRTPQEAMANSASNNIEYNVVIEGGRDVESNGEYYMAFDSSRFTLYQREGTEAKNVFVTTMYYKAPATVNLTDWVDIFVGYLELSNPTPLEASNGTLKQKDIYVNFINATDSYSTYNYIYLGSLRRTLWIGRIGRANNGGGGYLQHYLGNDYSQISFTENVDWAFFSHQEKYTEDIQHISGVVSQGQPVYLFVKNEVRNRGVNYTAIRKNRDGILSHESGRVTQL
ncbi:MAG: hypothetical protein RR706_08590 [Muribaculaceae bacterium]